MSEPDSPRWLNQIAGELRRDVPVRAAWRARLLDDVAHSPRPSAIDDLDDRFDEVLHAESPKGAARRAIVLTPLAGLAAAMLFVALGGGIMYAVLSRANGRDRAGPSVATQPLTGAGPVRRASTVTSAERELVRFELSAPRAGRVALVGSFNEWNPAVTPLVRDSVTGKWIVSLRLPPGRHVYAFVVDGDVTADPAAPRAADADFGSTNSVVFVSSPRT